VEIVAGTRRRESFETELRADSLGVIVRDREVGLQDRFPPLEPGGIHLAEELDVDLAIADLDGPAARREQRRLVALVRLARRRRREGLLGSTEPIPEGPPFPARDDRRH